MCEERYFRHMPFHQVYSHATKRVLDCIATAPPVWKVNSHRSTVNHRASRVVRQIARSWANLIILFRFASWRDKSSLHFTSFSCSLISHTCISMQGHSDLSVTSLQRARSVLIWTSNRQSSFVILFGLIGQWSASYWITKIQQRNLTQDILSCCP